MTRRFLLAALLMSVLAILFATGCKNGDDDDDGGDNGCGQVIESVEFVPDGPQGAASIWLDSLSYTPGEDAFDIVVKARGLTGVYGVGARILYDAAAGADEPDLVATAVPGPALGDTADLLSAAAAKLNHLVFGFTRTGDPTQSADISGEAVLGTLHFTLSDTPNSFSGAWSFDEDASHVMDNDLDPLSVDGWGGGTLTLAIAEEPGC